MYAVANGRTRGIYTTWKECQQQVIGFSGAKYKKFATLLEAEDYLEAAAAAAPAAVGAEPPPEVDYFVYTDGACPGNGRSTAAGGIGIYFAPGDPRNVSRAVRGGGAKITNNIAELTAVIEAHEIIRADLEAGKRIGIVTDSNYVILCVSTYGEKCEKAGWAKDIPNKELVRRAYELYKNTGAVFIYTRGHAGAGSADIHAAGNAAADQAAVAAAAAAKNKEEKITNRCL